MKTYSSSKFFALIFALAILSCTETIPTPIQEQTQSIFDLLYKGDLPTITLTGDLSHLFEDSTLTEKGKEEYFLAEFVFQDSLQELKMPVRLAKRGVTRKQICDFPPIKLKFFADTLEQRGFSRFNTYKIVTHCIDNQEELILREYLVYKIYNLITPNSFRVQLIIIHYEDSSPSMLSQTHYALIIEEDKELADRKGGELYEDQLKTIDKDEYAQMVVFQYMIGNTDWNLNLGHNIKWFKKGNDGLPIPIPYDFDYCGLVNSPHAAPHPQIPIKNVRERFLQWRGKTKDELRPICDRFIADKSQITGLIEKFSVLSPTSKDEMLLYLNSFFEQVEQGDL